MAEIITETPSHVAIVPAPGMGHLIPLVELAKRIIQLQGFNFNVTLIIPTTSPLSTSQSSSLQSLPTRITHTLLPPADLHDLPDDLRIETVIFLTMRRSLPSIRAALGELAAAKRLVSVVVDGFGTDVFDIARELNVSPFLYYGSGAMCLSLSLYLPELHEKVDCEYRDMKDPVEIPGSVSVRGVDLFDPIQDRKNDAYKWILHHSKRCYLAEGIMLNSFKKLEPETLKTLERPGYPRIYPIGPLVQVVGSLTSSESVNCLKWLDDQPIGSVLYVSFGSGGTLSHDQLYELAVGLEMSGQRFLWVVRSPNEEATNGAYFHVQNNDPFTFFPKGYLERIQGRGFVVPNWAPQAQILNHASTGGFLTHCGWNSTLESVMAGVPLIAWPLFAEQKMNAILLTDVLKVALRPKMSKNGLIEGVEIAHVVRSLMEGEDGKQVRSKMRDLKNAAKEELSEEASSSKSLVQVASAWTSKIST